VVESGQIGVVTKRRTRPSHSTQSAGQTRGFMNDGLCPIGWVCTVCRTAVPKGKEEIATSLLAQRRSELAAWIRAEPQTPELARRAALRWIEHATPAQLQAMRFARANRPFMQKLGEKGELLRAGFENVEDAARPLTTSVLPHWRLRPRGCFSAEPGRRSGPAAPPSNSRARRREALLA
jgi:hypothetical protein